MNGHSMTYIHQSIKENSFPILKHFLEVVLWGFCHHSTFQQFLYDKRHKFYIKKPNVKIL